MGVDTTLLDVDPVALGKCEVANRMLISGEDTFQGMVDYVFVEILSI